MNQRLENLYKAGKLLFGGDFNPEQWLDRPDILEEDIRMMKEAHINVATLGVFAWSVLEPEEGNYQLDWLGGIIDRLYENGIYTVLATPSGARPVWMDETYPEVLRVDRDGVRHKRGIRHNHCMTSPAYRRKVVAIDTQLAKRFGRHPGLLLWHISNEFGGDCFCPLCQKKFQKYLSEKFNGDIEALNKEWWTTFWSHKYQRFDQIEPPFSIGENSIMGLTLEWKRFTTWNMTDYMKEEIAVFRRETPDIPVVTNFMTIYDGLDYHVMEKELDIVSWDSYPPFHNDYETAMDTALFNSFNHALFRGMKRDQPFMMMESAPGLVNWQPCNKMQRPGVHTLMALQAVACGSDSAMYFQWRKGRGSFEQYHGAVIDHLGKNTTRIYKEVQHTGAILEKLQEVTGSIVHARAAVFFDWDNRWAIDDMKGLSEHGKRYEDTCIEQYKILQRMGIETDIISRDDDLSRYELVVAPMLYLLGGITAEHLRAYVQQGGQLVATYLCGYVNENCLCYLGGFPGDGLTELFGLYSEEIDSLYPTDRNRMVFSDGASYEIQDFAEVIRVNDAEILATYESDYYAGEPALTCRSYGKGKAWYVAARCDSDGMKWIYRLALEAAEGGSCTGQSRCSCPAPADLPENIEHHCRENDAYEYHFYLNHGTDTMTIPAAAGEDMLSGHPVQDTLTLEGRTGTVVRRKK